jgi:nitrosuccinate lyase
MHHQPADAGMLSRIWAETPVADLTSDEAWVRTLLDAEVALARIRARYGIVPPHALSAIEDAARGDSLAGMDLTVDAGGTANPVAALAGALANAVKEKDASAAQFVNAGDTTSDVLDTTTMLITTRVLACIDDDLRRTAAALAELAERYRRTLLNACPHSQPATPVSFGLIAAGWLDMVLDARIHLAQVVEKGLPAQLGAAAGTVASYQQ